MKKIIRSWKNLFVLGALFGNNACVSIHRDGNLVRHYFGYIRVVTPADKTGDLPYQVSKITTLGAWLDNDHRKIDENQGSGIGLGFRSDYRAILPKQCRVVFRVANSAQIQQINDLFGEILEDDLCSIKEP